MAKWSRAKFWHDYVSLHGFMRCELCGWRHPCETGYECHHIISRQLVKGNKRALKHVHKFWYIFLGSLCPRHNQTADCWEDRHILLTKRTQLFGAEAVAVAVRKLLDLMKSDVPELHRYLGE